MQRRRCFVFRRGRESGAQVKGLVSVSRGTSSIAMGGKADADRMVFVDIGLWLLIIPRQQERSYQLEGREKMCLRKKEMVKIVMGGILTREIK